MLVNKHTSHVEHKKTNYTLGGHHFSFIYKDKVVKSSSEEHWAANLAKADTSRLIALGDLSCQFRGHDSEHDSKEQHFIFSCSKTCGVNSSMFLGSKDYCKGTIAQPHTNLSRVCQILFQKESSTI